MDKFKAGEIVECTHMPYTFAIYLHEKDEETSVILIFSRLRRKMRIINSYTKNIQRI